MQPASGDFALSPATQRSSYEQRKLDTFTTRRLSVAIDALRREGEAILWEMNSLRTQIITLEQRIIGQTEELDMISRNLAALREQHKIMELQYQEKLHVLRSELRAAQEGQPSKSTNASASDHERHRSLSFLDAPQSFGVQHSPRRSIPQPPPLTSLPKTQVPESPVSHQEQTRYMVEDRDTGMHSAAFGHAYPATLLQSPSTHSPYDTQRRSPHGNYKQSKTRPHDRHDSPRNGLYSASPTRLEPSLSPTLVGSCSDGPSRSKPWNHDYTGSK